MTAPDSAGQPANEVDDKYGVAEAVLSYYLARGDAGYAEMVEGYQANPDATEFDGLAEQLHAACRNPADARTLLQSMGITEIDGQPVTAAVARRYLGQVLDELKATTSTTRTVNINVHDDDAGTYDYVKGLDTKDTATKLREIWLGTRWRGLPIIYYALAGSVAIFAGWGLAVIDVPYLSQIGAILILFGLVGVFCSAMFANIKRNDIRAANDTDTTAPAATDGGDGKVWWRRIIAK